MCLLKEKIFLQKLGWSSKVKRKNSWFNFKNSSKFIVSISIIKFPIALTWIKFFGVLYVCSCARVCYFFILYIYFFATFVIVSYINTVFSLLWNRFRKFGCRANKFDRTKKRKTQKRWNFQFKPFICIKLKSYVKQLKLKWNRNQHHKAFNLQSEMICYYI